MCLIANGSLTNKSFTQCQPNFGHEEVLNVLLGHHPVADPSGSLPVLMRHKSVVVVFGHLNGGDANQSSLAL